MRIYSDVVLAGGLTYSNTIGDYTFTRNIQSKVSESVSVLDFGAKGDGVTDDSVAINRALNSVVGKGGGQVVFPPGTYSIAAQLGKRWSGISSQEVSLDIVGVDATIFTSDPIYSYGLFLQGDFKSISVKDLVIEGNSLLTAGLVIDGSGGVVSSGDIADYNTDSIIVENVRVYNLMGLTQSRAEVTGIKISNAESAVIRNCKTENLTRWSWLTKRNHSVSWLSQTQSGYWIDVAGISAVDCQRLTLTECTVKDISHGNSRNMNPEDPTSPFPNWVVPGGTQGTFGTPVGGVSKYMRLYDSNGIRVYNGRDVTNRSRYLRQQSIIANNTMIDCDNRFIKLQTNGQCTVDNNVFYLGQDPYKVAKPLCGYQWEGHPFFGATMGNDNIPYPGVRCSSLAPFIDSQIANVKITNNKFYIDDYWVGHKNGIYDSLAYEETGLTPSFYVDPTYSPAGHTYSNEWPYGIQASYNDNDFSPSVVIFQTPTSATTLEPYESYYSQYENNELYSTKLWRNGIQMQAPRLGSTASIFTTIKNNIHSSNAIFSKTSLNSREDVAHTYFLRATVPYGPSAASGQWVMDVSQNKVWAYEWTYFALGGTYSTTAVDGSPLDENQQAQLPRDFSNNWTWHIYDNSRYPQAGNNELFRTGRDGITGASVSLPPFTSSLMARNNLIGDVDGYISVPIDLKKVLNGSDFYIGGTSYFFFNPPSGATAGSLVNNRIKNVPDDDQYSHTTSVMNSRIYKHGNITYIDGSNRLYRSLDCETWKYMDYSTALASTYSTFSSEYVV